MAKFSFLLLALVAASQVFATQDVIAASAVAANGLQEIAIDVSHAFVDKLGNDHMLQVNLNLVVAKGVVMFNNVPVARETLNALRLSATMYEKLRSTGAVLNVRPVSVFIQVSVAEGMVNGANVLSVQELIRDVDGTHISAISVQEAIVQIDTNGNELTRIVSEIAVAESRLAPATTTTTAAATTTSADIGLAPEADSPESPDSPNSPDSPDSPSEHHKRGHCRLCKWYHRQSFAARVAIAAGVSFVSLLVIYLFSKACIACCCPGARHRAVYLDNVKMHYEALPTMDDKKTVIV